MRISQESAMPTKTAIERAKKDAREGKSPTTQAGEFVREVIEHVREGKHGVRSAKQAIAIGLSEARRAGVKLPPRPGNKADAAANRARKKKPSAKRARATLKALRREPHSTVSHDALARQAHASAEKRGAANRRRAAAKALRTKGSKVLQSAGRKATQTRARRQRAR